MRSSDIIAPLTVLLALIYLCGPLALHSVAALEASPGSGLKVVPLNSTFNVTPGSSFTVPIKVINGGNSTIRNLTISMPYLQGVIMAGWENVSLNLPPGTSRVIRFPVRVLQDAPAGLYNVTVAVKTGNLTSVFTVHVRVALIPLYSMNVTVGRRYHVGQNVTLRFLITSKANGVLRGPVWMRVYRNGKQIHSQFSVVFLNPGESWVYNYTLVDPPLGNYTAVMVANLSGKRLTIERSFLVFRRSFTIDAWFANGYIHVEVKLTNGTPLSGLTVRVNSMKFRTDEKGEVRVPVDRPGIYVVSAGLDGVNKSVDVYVRSLVLSTALEGDDLILTVLSSTGVPVPNASVAVSGPKGSFSGRTGSDGTVTVPLSTVGRGVLLIDVSDPRYLGLTKMIHVPVISSSSTSAASTSTSPTTSSPASSGTSSPAQSSSGSGTSASTRGGKSSTGTGTGTAPSARTSGIIWIIPGVAVLLFSLTAYVAFLRPQVVEDELKSYYFVKVRAPRFRHLKNFRFEKPMNAVEVRSTKGRARIEGNRVVWEIDDLAPGEEAILQVILG